MKKIPLIPFAGILISGWLASLWTQAQDKTNSSGGIRASLANVQFYLEAKPTLTSKQRFLAKINKMKNLLEERTSQAASGLTNHLTPCPHPQALLPFPLDPASLYGEQHLFISAGKEDLEKALKLANDNSDIKVVVTDIVELPLPDGAKTPNLKIELIDNSNPALFGQFPDNSFDRILMNHGLCFCKKEATSCAGITSCGDLSLDFWTEMIRILNKKNTQSEAIFTADAKGKGLDHFLKILNKAAEGQKDKLVLEKITVMDFQMKPVFALRIRLR